MSIKPSIRLPYLIVYAIAANLLHFILPIPPIVLRSTWLLLIIYGFCKYIKFGLNNFEKAFCIFAIYNMIHFVMSLMSSPMSTTEIGATILISLTFVVFGIMGRLGKLDDKFFWIAGVLLIAVGIPAYYHEEQVRLVKLMMMGSTADQTTVNASTLFLMILPIVFVIKKKLTSIGIFIVCLFFIILSAKRGNIAAAAVPAVLYIYIVYESANKTFFKRFLITLAIVVVASYAWESIINNEYLVSRYEDTLEGKTSGRNDIYFSFWKLWSEGSNAWQFYFGFGYHGTLIYGSDGRFAHQDWLEILVDFGLVGLILYLSAFICFYKLFRRTERMDCKFTMLSILAIWLCKASISMGFTDERFAIMAIPYGYVMCKSFKRKIINKTETNANYR